jgi:thioesterase domain-containing protein
MAESLLSSAELEQYLHRAIPLAQVMDVRVMGLSIAAVTLSAPLAPNVNHHDTVFGGSAASVALLAGWSLLHVRLSTAGLEHRLVVQRHSMEHERPITAAFLARAQLSPSAQWTQFAAMLARRGKARISVGVRLEQSGERVASLLAEFVALRAAR